MPPLAPVSAPLLPGVHHHGALAPRLARRARGPAEPALPRPLYAAEPYLGHLGFAQEAACAKLTALFAERGIVQRAGVGINRVGGHMVTLDTGETLPATASIIMPPFTGAADIWKNPQLTDDRGIVPVNERYQHIAHPDIYAAGVARSFAHPVPPLGERRAPRTGYLSIRMGQAAAEHVAASLGCGRPAARTLPYVLDVRMLDGGSAGLFLASWGTRDPRNAAVLLPRSVAHYLKAFQERYLVWRLRTGRMNLP